MAFCGNCGKQMEDGGRFCPSCGADTKAAASSATAPPMPVAAASAAAPASIPIPVMPPMGAVPHANGAAPFPVVIQQPPPKRNSMTWVVIAVVALLVGGYAYQRVKPATNGDGTPSGAPSQPGPQNGPQDQATLVREQNFSGHWQAVYGFVDLTNTSWTNHAAIAMQSATLECDQYSTNGTQLSQYQTRLNGPVQPGTMVTFNPFQMGSVSTYMTKVTCNIVAVVPAS